MTKLLMIALATTTAFAGAAQAQSYGPRPAYVGAGGYEDGCRGGRFTLAGAHAGVTVLGVDVGASAGLHVGLHDRCGGGRGAAYAPPPERYPPQPYGAPSYGPPPYAQAGGYDYGEGSYAEPGYAQPAYSQPSYGPAGAFGYAYAGQSGYGYGPSCGC